MILSTLLTLAALQAPVKLGFARYEPIPGRCTVGFDGTSTLHDFTGKTDEVHGALRVDLDHVDASAAGEFWIEAAGLDTDNESRDEQMREHLDVEHFPRITFTIDSVAGLVSERAGSLTGKGRFTIKDVSRQRTFPLSVEAEGDRSLHVQGHVGFDIRDHGIAPPDKIVVGMGERVTVWFDLHLRPIEAKARPATRQRLEIHERIEVSGQPAVEVRRTESLWYSPDGLLWERPQKGELATSTRAGLRIVDMRSLTAETVARDAEDSFAESREHLANFESKLAQMSPRKRARAGKKIQGAIDRLRLSLENAPAAGAAEVRREGDVVRVLLGGLEWARAEGLEGDASIALLANATVDLPREVRAALARLTGTPTTLVLRTASHAGVRTTTYDFGAAIEGSTPSWAWNPDSWTTPATGEVHR